MIRRIMTELEFPTEAIEYLAKKNAELSACESVKDELHEAYDYLFDYRDGEYMPVLNTVAQKSGIRVETVTMLFMLNAAITAKYMRAIGARTSDIGSRSSITSSASSSAGFSSSLKDLMWITRMPSRSATP